MSDLNNEDTVRAQAVTIMNLRDLNEKLATEVEDLKQQLESNKYLITKIEDLEKYLEHSLLLNEYLLGEGKTAGDIKYASAKCELQIRDTEIKNLKAAHAAKVESLQNANSRAM
jgi:hypothetical protein